VHHEPDDTVLAARTAFLIPARDEQLRTYRLLEAMHQTVIAGMNPGVRASQVYNRCVATFERNGLRLAMPHSGTRSATASTSSRCRTPSTRRCWSPAWS